MWTVNYSVLWSYRRGWGWGAFKNYLIYGII